MMPLDTSAAKYHAQDTMLDANALDHIRAKGREKDPEALREVARQFEALFVQQLMKNMRSANEVFGKDSYFDSDQTRFYQEMFDEQLGLHLTQGKGIGIAEAFYDQMQRAYGEKMTGDAQPEPSGTLNKPTESAPAGGEKPVSSAEPAGTGGKASVADTPASFVQQLLPNARWAAQQLGVDPQALLAQAALETGWGRHVIHDGQGQNSFNLFNIKADGRWDGESIDVATLEFRDGVAQSERADFRRYQSYAQSFSDYVNFLQSNPRYQDALRAPDTDAFIERLQDAGFATDPAYASKIRELMRSEVIQSNGSAVANAGSQRNDV